LAVERETHFWVAFEGDPGHGWLTRRRSKEVTTGFLRPGVSAIHVTTRAPLPHPDFPAPSLLVSLFRPAPRPLRPRASPYCLTSDFFHLDISSTPWLIRHRIHDSAELAAEVIARNHVSRGQVPQSRSYRSRSQRFGSPPQERGPCRSHAQHSAHACVFFGPFNDAS
jgi:hypothetical protein